MHLSSLIISASLATTVLSQTIAQEIAALPSCSLSCISDAIASSGCGHTDYACQCGTANSAIQQSAAPCLYKVCSSNDISTVQGISFKVCEIQAASPSSSATGGSTATASNPQSTTHGSSSSATTSTSTNSSGPKKKGLSTGAAVGIGIGATAFVSLLIRALVFFIKRYRKRGKELRRLAAGSTVTETEMKKPDPHELQSVVSTGTTVNQELHSTGGSAVWSHASEVDGKEPRVVASYMPVELHAQER